MRALRPSDYPFPPAVGNGGAGRAVQPGGGGAESSSTHTPYGVRLPSRDEVAAVAGASKGLMRSTAFAARLGVHGRTVRRCFERGGLPGAKEHGPRILLVPTRLVRVAETWGLKNLELMARTGRLPGGAA